MLTIPQQYVGLANVVGDCYCFGLALHLKIPMYKHVPVFLNVTGAASSVEAFFDFDTPAGEEPEPPDRKRGFAGRVHDSERADEDILGRCFRFRYEQSIKYTAESRPIVESDALIAQCRARGISAERLFGEKEILLEAGNSVVGAA